MRVVLDYRPGSVLSAEFRPATGDWVVHVREVGGTRELAKVIVNDRTHQLREHYVLPFSQYPPRMTERQAIRSARRDKDFRREVRARGGLQRMTLEANYEDGTTWEVNAFRGRKVAVRADVQDTTARVTGVWTGHQIAWKMARGLHNAFGGTLNEWYVWWPLFIGFALVMLDFGRLRSWYNLDVLALLSFGVSHEFFDAARIDWSVPLAVPPLVYLFARMAHAFVRGVDPVATSDSQTAAGEAAADNALTNNAATDKPAARGRQLLARLRRGLGAWRVRGPATWLLVVLAVFAGGVRYGVDAYGSGVIDVGYAGVAGAKQVIEHNTPYGNMPQDNANGDTYGPLNYVVYVPAVLVWGDQDELEWDNGLPAAHAVSIISDLLCVFALALIGWRWISRRAAALLVCGWLLYPYTGFALTSNTNDLLVAALLLLAFAALPRAWLRGALVAAAAAVKFVPLVVLAPIAHAGVRRRLPQAVQVFVAAAVVALACWGWVASYPQGVTRFLDATIRFQYDRSSPFSVWGLYGWRTAQQVAQVLLALGLVAALLVPARRDFRQVAAGTAAALLGAQLVLQHWFYLYIPWFAGFVLVVLVARREAGAAALDRARQR